MITIPEEIIAVQTAALIGLPKKLQEECSPIMAANNKNNFKDKAINNILINRYNLIIGSEKYPMLESSRYLSFLLTTFVEKYRVPARYELLGKGNYIDWSWQDIHVLGLDNFSIVGYNAIKDLLLHRYYSENITILCCNKYIYGLLSSYREDPRLVSKEEEFLATIVKEYKFIKL